MKVELIEQYEPFSDQAWYGVKVDGSSVKWSRDKEVANVVYNNIINNIDATKTREIILQSQEIDVPLDK
tara:strand:+ start:615 stop:821 length:207 start_codon:yes stop_codon:yes gene_type:complete